MNLYAGSNISKSNAAEVKTPQKKDKDTLDAQHTDNRPEAITQRKLQEVANSSPQAKHTAHFQAITDVPLQTLQKKANNTGLPDKLKSGIESLSGHAMDDVQVHYNSDKPSGLQAHAYAQGNDIHLGTGQEKHLPHEAWHVLQQKQGRVQPTMQMKGNVNVNDDKGLEAEADAMGAKAAGGVFEGAESLATASSSGDSVQRKVVQNGDDTAALAATDEVVQRQIEYDSKKKVYKTNSVRPGWLVVAQDALLDEYNIRHDLTLSKLEYAKEKLDRCHVVAFEDIQSKLEAYLNAPTTNYAALDDFIGVITAHLISGGDEKKTIYALWKSLVSEVNGGSSGSTIESSANSLLSRLNSVSENLRAGNKYLNAYIGQNLDLFFQKTDSGKFQLTDHSRNILTNGSSYVSDVLRTPEHHSRLVTSEGPIDFGNMSPRSEKLTRAHPFETRKAKSKNVRDPLYGSKAQLHVKGYKQKPKVDPRILQWQTEVDMHKLEMSKFTQFKSDVEFDINKLLNKSKSASQYNHLLLSRNKLKQHYGEMINDYNSADNYLRWVGPKYRQNLQSINGLTQERDDILQSMKRTGNVDSYENHQQNMDTQMGLYNNNLPYDGQSYWKSHSEAVLLAGQQDVIDYNNKQQQVNDLNFQINSLRDENDRIHNTSQYLNKLSQKLKSLNQQIGQLNNDISEYEKYDNDVAFFNKLMTDFNWVNDKIAETDNAIKTLRQKLSTLVN